MIDLRVKIKSGNPQFLFMLIKH